MATARERVIEWLRDAHAVEEQAHTMLKKTAGQIEGHEEFRLGLDRHSQVSDQQAAKLKECLEQLGESTSTVKKIAGQASAFAQTVSGSVVGDEPVKAVLSISSFARMEVSSYRILVTAGEIAGLDAVSSLCRSLLAEEQEFSEWVDQQIEQVTTEFLTVQNADA